MPSFAGLSKFFGRTASEGAAFAAGVAVAPALSPVVREIVNEANSKYSSHPISPNDAAAIVAEDVDSYDFGKTEASYNGINETRFRALYGEALNAPGLGELFEMWRRDLISDADFVHGLRKAKLETRWDTGLEGLRDRLLSSEELAMMQQQGFVSDTRANSEGALQGVTSERQQLRFEASGLPPGIAEAFVMLRRNIITPDTFAQIVREGHTKTKYTDVLLQLEQQILSAATAVRAHLKGHIDVSEMHARGAEWGYSPADMDLWYESEGRPATAHQIHLIYARGGSVPGAVDEHDAILKAVAQSDIRPEYGEGLYISRYTMPSAFVLRALVQAGTLSEADGERILIYSGWDPDLAKKVATSWAGGSTGAAKDPLVTKAQTQLWTATHRAYVNDEATADQARGELAALGADTAAQDAVLALWDREREVVRLSLTPSQIKKAFADAIFTRDDAIARLERLGMTASDAGTLLDE